MIEQTRTTRPLAAISGTWEANGTRICLTLAHDPHGGWNVLWPDGGWMGRAYVPNLRSSDGKPERVDLQSKAGRLTSKPDRAAIALILLHLLPELARLELGDRPVRELAEIEQAAYCACGRVKSECDGSRAGCHDLPGHHAAGACPCMSRDEPGPPCSCECHRLPLPRG